MSLFFDAKWFDARLGEQGMGRAQLAEAAGLSATGLHDLFANARAATAEELQAFARCLGVELVEVSLRAGVANLAAPADGDPGARIDSIEARLDAIDSWLAELEQEQRKRA